MNSIFFYFHSSKLIKRKQDPFFVTSCESTIFEKRLVEQTDFQLTIVHTILSHDVCKVTLFDTTSLLFRTFILKKRYCLYHLFQKTIDRCSHNDLTKNSERHRFL